MSEISITIEGGPLAQTWADLPPGTLWEFVGNDGWVDDPCVFLRLEDKGGPAPENDISNLMLSCAGIRRFRLSKNVALRPVRVIGRLRLDLPGLDRWIDG